MNLSRQLLSLIESTDIPISTPDLIAITGRTRSQVWTVLEWLRDGGLITSEARRTCDRSKPIVCKGCKCVRKNYSLGLCAGCYQKRPDTRAGIERQMGHTVTYWGRIHHTPKENAA